MQKSTELGDQQRSLENDLHWLGGIIDGEGAIMAIARKERNRKNNSYIPKISIVNTNPIIIEDCIKVLRQLGIPFYINFTKGMGTWKPKMEIDISGYKRVMKALPILLPYIRSKKMQSEKLFKLVSSRITRRNDNHGQPIPYDADERKLAQEIKELNNNSLILSETIRREWQLKATKI